MPKELHKKIEKMKEEMKDAKGKVDAKGTT